jgi:hypothetical protein
MELILGLVLVLALFIGGMLLSEYAYQAGDVMEERRAIVFEVYRYAICFLMVVIFGIMAFQMIGALIIDAANSQAMAGPGVGVMISGMIFLVHWFMKNPMQPKSPVIVTPIAPES